MNKRASLNKRTNIRWVQARKWVILLCLTIFLLLTGGACHRYAMTPVNPATLGETVFIPKGSGFLRITDILNDAGLVRNRPLFWILALGNGGWKHVQAGEYELSGSMTPSAIIDKMVRGDIKKYRITLPEDITASEVADKFAAATLIDGQEFATLASDRSFLASLDIEADSIEGYLYPDTYEFTRSMTTEEIIRTVVGRFWKRTTLEMRKRAQEIGLTQHQWVTLASIIGKESGNPDEKRLISAVFHNRLARGMKLQSDPTAVYDPGKRGETVKTILRSHLQSDTPYNTYRIAGLPPGPIANPGIDSLLAALYPAKVDYLYFVSRNDGSHEFSTHLAAHNRAIVRHQIKRQKK